MGGVGGRRGPDPRVFAACVLTGGPVSPDVDPGIGAARLPELRRLVAENRLRGGPANIRRYSDSLEGPGAGDRLRGRRREYPRRLSKFAPLLGAKKN